MLECKSYYFHYSLQATLYLGDKIFRSRAISYMDSLLYVVPRTVKCDMRAHALLDSLTRTI